MGLGAGALALLVIGGLALLIADLYAIVQSLQSSESGVLKIFWVVLILVMPVIGLIIWLLAGPRAGARA